MLHNLFGEKRNYNTSHLEIRQSIIHGKGVFSKTIFKAGRLIEEAPIILIDNAGKDLLHHSLLYHYYFLVNNPVTPVAMGLGYSALYNHSADANAQYCINLANLSISIKACKKIIVGEEITINYNGRHNDISPVYFPRND
jgi:hypothetical protein